jgi:hypothetical protein
VHYASTGTLDGWGRKSSPASDCTPLSSRRTPLSPPALSLFWHCWEKGCTPRSAPLSPPLCCLYCCLSPALPEADATCCLLPPPLPVWGTANCVCCCSPSQSKMKQSTLSISFFLSSSDARRAVHNSSSTTGAAHSDQGRFKTTHTPAQTVLLRRGIAGHQGVQEACCEQGKRAYVVLCRLLPWLRSSWAAGRGLPCARSGPAAVGCAGGACPAWCVGAILRPQLTSAEWW